MMQSRFNFFIVILPCIFVSAFLAPGLYLLSHPEMRLRNREGGTDSAVAWTLLEGLVPGPGDACCFWEQAARFVDGAGS